MNVNETKYTTYLHNFGVFFNIGFQWHDKVDVKSLELQEKSEEPKKKMKQYVFAAFIFSDEQSFKEI